MMSALDLPWEIAGARTETPTTAPSSVKSPDTQIPAMASPLPLNRPLLCLILIRATIPSIKPTNEDSPQVKTPRMPNTTDEIARPLDLEGIEPVRVRGICGPPGAFAPVRSASLNSGNVERGPQSLVPDRKSTRLN